MNETKKTGIFWGVAAVVVLIATFVAWPTTTDENVGPEIGVAMFPEFKDPLFASSLHITTFDEAQGELKTFKVRKDAESGLWKIQSKGNYPADAVEQMRDAANALVALNSLDAPTDNREDHAGMGVVEPDLANLNPGDEGVGRLVTFKDSNDKTLASLIIGSEVKDQVGQLYVRKPGQDQVYVVALDATPLSTKFEDWIEEDLLQLSSIDVENVEVKDYSASLGIQGVSLERNYVVELDKEGSTWTLAALKEYDKTNPLAEPTEVAIDPAKKLNSQKLNDLANALDDLKFVDVKRKPEGISANLKTDKDFATDNDAARQLAGRGFIPVPLGPNREIEILSANGELTATTKDGVKYILRFGNISGITESGKDGEEASEEDSQSSSGVNRYLMVSTIVDETDFPVPELKPIPNTLEELDALDKPEPPAGVVLPPELNAPQQPETEETESAEPQGDKVEPEMKETVGEGEAGDSESKEEPQEESAEPASKESEGEAEKAEEPATDEAAAADSGETEASGEGESSGVGEGQEPAEAGDEKSGDEPAEQAAEEKSEAPTDPADEKTPDDKGEAMKAADAPASDTEETEEEKLERLAAVQEKITKENERKLDARKERLEKARLQSKMLNERFADWYYVIPEATYSKLRISRDDLFESSDAGATPNPAAMPPQMPNFQFPGSPGN